MTSRRVAAIDCGTNSIRLLVADVDAETGTLVDVDRRMEVVRLGQGVDRTGRIAPEALERTLAATRTYAEALREHGATAVRFVATSASRDAENRQDFVDGVRDVLGVEPEVVTGEEEAALSFAGATRELTAAGVPGPYLVVDIGGGSTEFVLGDASGVRAARSVDVGCVRLTERHVRHDPPTTDEVAAVRADAEAAVSAAGAEVPLREARTLVAVAGTATTVAAMALDLPRYDSALIHRSRIAADDVRDVTSRLLLAPAAERAALPFMHPGRVDVIGAGALVLQTVVDRLAVTEVVISEHDILDGIAWSIG
ncbi:exopolyphosphatase/guanosine-5'-triphosphate,3'-diphosphate pyrophosphatase [Motilibacter rhizosphaerae]|uniref:Exopolyphosphatase/guanosine-5'-triphosphate, 3'-diphosphate pyrophosphatase n=1 Tax=Motilibacter rhizosphaerae TaxID=598652 RepID=A0A4Q7NQE7_9ACTN|nr:Ppx/GppA phosphatase family protein [Motilibacter rhizosphaerae]RZS87352.1 exopolyphosphatase/guanosine-5'-triphosphate,3'-diphosphate pyrophosphatase [Motilibacter rhizosphaerae]